MRLRNKPWAKPLIAKNSAKIVIEPAIYRGKWQSRFVKRAPLFLEIGMGKGKFIIEMAKKHPENNYIGMELQTTVAAMALKRLLQADEMPTNLQLVCGNGNQLLEFFASNEISGIF